MIRGREISWIILDELAEPSDVVRRSQISGSTGVILVRQERISTTELSHAYRGNPRRIGAFTVYLNNERVFASTESWKAFRKAERLERELNHAAKKSRKVLASNPLFGAF